MSRRVPNPAADRAAANQSTIKTLLKLEGNKSCADCKRNKRMMQEDDCAECEDKANSAFRPKVGKLESGHLRLHPVGFPPTARGQRN